MIKENNHKTTLRYLWSASLNIQGGIRANHFSLSRKIQWHASRLWCLEKEGGEREMFLMELKVKMCF